MLFTYLIFIVPLGNGSLCLKHVTFLESYLLKADIKVAETLISQFARFFKELIFSRFFSITAKLSCVIMIFPDLSEPLGKILTRRRVNSFLLNKNYGGHSLAKGTEACE